MSTIHKLEKQGRLEPADATSLEASIQGQMKQIIDSPPEIKITESLRYLHTIPALSDLSEIDLEFFSTLFQEKVYPIHSTIAIEDNPSDGFSVIVRGSARIEKESTLLRVAQPGYVVGAFESLAGVPFWASIKAESPVTVLKFNTSSINKELKKKQNILDKLWLFAGFDMAERFLIKVEPWASWRTKKLRTYINNGTVEFLRANQTIDLTNKVVILLKGEVIEHGEKVLSAPSLINNATLKANFSSILFVLSNEPKEA
jgi:hypothetical protein